MAEPTRVAIIMRSLDEQPHADRSLAALASQSHSRFTLYNVDSGSTDGTLEAVRRFNPDPGKVVTIPPEAYVPGPVLNAMIERTTEPIVVFLNADAVPLDERWLERLLAPILSGLADATMSRQVARPSARFIVRYDYERAYARRADGESDARHFSAVAAAFRRELWEETKFQSEGYAEDAVWARACLERGARFMLVPESVVEHSHDYTLKGLYRKRHRHGLAFALAGAEKAQALRQAALWAREVVRDGLHAVKRLRPDSIPYNLVYRTVIHVAYHRGRRDGERRRA